MPMGSSPALPVPTVKTESGKRHMTRTAKVIVAVVAGPLVLIVGFVVICVIYYFSTPELVTWASTGDAARVEALLAMGADVNATSVNKSTALHLAAFGGQTRVVATLLRYSPNLESRNTQGETPLMLAASAGHAAIVSMLLARHADPNAMTDKGVTALHAAALNGNMSMIEGLLAQGVNIDAKTTNGNSPLFWAAAGGRTEAARVLLEHKANLEGRNAKGRTPLMAASDSGRDDVVRLLLANGADVNARDRDGRTARELARIASRGQVLRVLDGKTAGDKPMERYSQPYGTFVEVESQSSWSLLLDRFSWFLAIVAFPSLARFLERPIRSGRHAALSCYFRTVGICVGCVLLTAIISGVVLGLLGIPFVADERAIRSFGAVVVGGILSAWIASKRSRRHTAVLDSLVQPADLVRSDGIGQWAPVQQVAGAIAVQQAPAPPSSCGQVPSYSHESTGAAARSVMAPAALLPPGLHWAVLLMLTVVTFGIFGAIWTFVEAAYAHRLRTSSKPLFFYGIGIPAFFVAGVMSVLPDLKAFAALFQIAGLVFMIAGHFSLKNALEEYYNSVEPINLQLSGGMTFFFNVLYFQYHLSKIRDWKRTGFWHSGIPSFRDAQQQERVIYTQSELEAMRNRPLSDQSR